MQTIEKFVSPFIENQFPQFYKEEGPQFIAFVKAYYEWMEQANNVLYHTRRLPDYRDIDTTLDQFILQFKEKYLKNIQFDTATNKQLLVKNSFDLYRSKGTDRAVDLFFKLVYGTQAEVKYPGEDVLRLSDGIWQKPTYLEVTDTPRNVDYVGKRIQGTRSNAVAFVERYIKRRIRDGYVNILYITNIEGNFEKNEVLAYIGNNNPIVYESSDPIGKSPELIGSVREVVIQDGGRDFNIGDIVSFSSSQKGLGGLARVDQIVDTTGVVDFIFIDGGWGYTLSSNSTSSLAEQRKRAKSIVSEKVITVKSAVADDASKNYFRILEPLVQRLVKIEYSAATDYPIAGEKFFRYAANGELTSTATIISYEQDEDGNGNTVVSVLSGPMTANVTYYNQSNLMSFLANTVTNQSIAGKVMGIPNTYMMGITGLTGGNISVGDYVYQQDVEGIYSWGTVSSIQTSPFGNTMVLEEANGAFKYSNVAYTLNPASFRFNTNTAVQSSNDFIVIPGHEFAANTPVRYVTPKANTAIPGLQNNYIYFVLGSNSTGVSLSHRPGGNAVTINAASFSEVHEIVSAERNFPFTRFNPNTGLSGGFISTPNSNNQIRFKNGDVVKYVTEAGNTAVVGLSNNGVYYIVEANTLGFKLTDVYNGTPLVITSNSSHVANTLGTGHSITGQNVIRVRNKPEVRADFANVDFTVGAYEIEKFVYTANFVDATANTTLTQYIYQYNPSGNVIAKGLVVTINQSGANGDLTFVPLKGYFSEAEDFHTDGNVAIATITTIAQLDQGGDYTGSAYGQAISQHTNTHMFTTSTSFGSGAQFSIASIGDSEVIYINTDIIGNNNEVTLDYDRKILNVGSNTGFSIGDYVYQSNGAMTAHSFDASLVSNTTNFIPIASNPFANGNKVIYTAPGFTRIAGANTFVGGLNPGEEYFVVGANSTGVKLSETLSGTAIAVEPKANSENHFLTGTNKMSSGLVFNVVSANLYIKDVRGEFQNTAGIYSNIVLASNTAVNTAISDVDYFTTVIIPPQRPFAALPVTTAAYGFPKNPQGDYQDIIFTCLTFERFDIGTIGGLSGVDPGSEYNVDPYVLAYQPYISAFDRRDFIIKIANVTDAFIIGEKITQTPVDLIYYDIEVVGGVIDDVYNEITSNFDPLLDVNGTSNTILIPYKNVTINPNTAIDGLISSFNSQSDVLSVVDFISVNGHLFTTDDQVTYFTDTGTSVLSGLSNNTSYYILGSNTNGFSLSTSVGGAAIGITASTTSQAGHYIRKAVNNFISVTGNEFIGNTTYNDKVLYYTDTGNTAITGLTNNTLYFIRSSNKFGFALSTTAGGANVSITPSAVSETGHNFKAYRNTFANNDAVIYNSYTAAAISGLANNDLYYVVNGDDYSVKLSTTKGGTAIDLTAGVAIEPGHYLRTIPGYLPGDYVYQEVVKTFNANTGVSTSADMILLASNPYEVGDELLYYTASGNTVISGLANNTAYYVVLSNTSGVVLSNTVGGTTLNITASAISEAGHNIKSIPTAKVNSVRVSNNDFFVRVQNTNNTFANSFPLLSNSNPYIDESVLDISLFSTTATAVGIVKEQVVDTLANTNLLFVKRLTFENTWIENETIRGDVSGSEATILGVSEDSNTMPIGLNAEISANVTAANGVITTLQVVDSGLGYPNSEIIQYSSEDGLRSGSGKVVIDNYGLSKGYYRSSKGFLSADKYIHDGDFYQEYSYEILSKIGFEKYADMFKKVLHVAGTRFFGSAYIVEEANSTVIANSIVTGEQIMFNAKLDVNDVNNTIELDIEKDSRNFNPLSHINQDEDFITIRRNPFEVNQIVTYKTDTGNTVVSGLANSADYYIVFSNTSGVKLSATRGGIPVNITTGLFQNGHIITSYTNPFANGDLVQYSLDGFEFNGQTDVDNLNDFIYLVDHNVDNNDELLYRTANTIDPLGGLANNTYYYAVSANTSGIKLSTTVGGAAVNLVPTTIRFSGSSSVNTDIDFIAIANNLLVNNDLVVYTKDARAYSIPGIEAEQTYYVVQANSTGIKLSTAANGTPIDLRTTSVAFDGASNIITKNVIKSFNSRTSVSNTNDTITFASNHAFVNSDVVTYYTSAGNTAILQNNHSYYITNTTPTTIQLASIAGAAPMDLTAGAIENGHFIKRNDTTEDLVIIQNNTLKLDDQVKYYTANGTTAVGGLTNNNLYFVVSANSVSVKLSSDRRGPAIDLTAVTSGVSTGQYLDRQLSGNNYTLSKILDVGGAGHFLLQRTPMAALKLYGQYYVTNTNSKSVQLALTANGSAINIAPNANTETGHYLTRLVEEL